MSPCYDEYGGVHIMTNNYYGHNQQGWNNDERNTQGGWNTQGNWGEGNQWNAQHGQWHGGDQWQGADQWQGQGQWNQAGQQQWQGHWVGPGGAGGYGGLPEKKKSSTGLIVGIIAGAVVVVGGGVALAFTLGGDDAERTAGDDTTRQTSGDAGGDGGSDSGDTTGIDGGDGGASDGNMGETQTVAGVDFTVSNERAGWPELESDPMAFGPSDGQEWLLVDVTVVNNTNDTLSTMFDLSLDYFVDGEYYYESCGMLDSDYFWHGEIQPGETLDAISCLAVPEGGLEGVWSVSSFSTGDIAEWTSYN